MRVCMKKFLKNLKEIKLLIYYQIKLLISKKKNDKEQILDIFDKGDENIEEFFKKKEVKNKFDEDEFKFILLKNKNMKLMNKEKNKKMNLNGNLYKKHLLTKYKKID